MLGLISGYEYPVVDFPVNADYVSMLDNSVMLSSYALRESPVLSDK